MWKSLWDYLLYTKPINQSFQQCEIRCIRDMYRGMFATGNLKQGDIVMVEMPLYVGESKRDILIAVQNETSDRKKEAFLNLQGCRIVDKLNINSWSIHCIVPCIEAPNMAVYNSGSYFNHSCRPNCFALFFKDAMCIIALQDIREGVELTVSYIPLGYCGYAHLKRLKTYATHFSCECKECPSPNDTCGICKHQPTFQTAFRKKKNPNYRTLCARDFFMNVLLTNKRIYNRYNHLKHVILNVPESDNPRYRQNAFLQIALIVTHVHKNTDTRDLVINHSRIWLTNMFGRGRVTDYMLKCLCDLYLRKL